MKTHDPCRDAGAAIDCQVAIRRCGEDERGHELACGIDVYTGFVAALGGGYDSTCRTGYVTHSGLLHLARKQESKSVCFVVNNQMPGGVLVVTVALASSQCEEVHPPGTARASRRPKVSTQPGWTIRHSRKAWLTAH